MHVPGGRDENINFLFFWTVDLFLLSSKWVFWKIYLHQGSFPGGSGGKESTYNVGDPGSIPGSGSSLGEGNDSPLQYSCLEKSHGWRNLVDCKESDRLSDFTFTFIFIKNEGCSVVSDSLRPPWTIQSMEFSRPEYWSVYPFPCPGNLPDPGIEPRSPALQADSLPAEPQGMPPHPAFIFLL